MTGSLAVGLDFETFSSVNLPKAGLHNYVSSPDFAPLLACMWTPKSTRVFDFVCGDGDVYGAFRDALKEYHHICAHNSEFERTVLREMSIPMSVEAFTDTAVIAAAAGASRHLGGAAPQLLNEDKMEEGLDLIRLFSIPNQVFDFERPTKEKIIKLGLANEWRTFIDYCMKDAQLSYRIGQVDQYSLSNTEIGYDYCTKRMNKRGWHVDREALAHMQRQYEQNLLDTLANFRELYDRDDELNFSSPKQLQDWCRARGIRAKSFDEKNVEKLIGRVAKRIDQGGLSPDKLRNYSDVLAMLITQQELGGSALKKLAVIDAMADPETGMLYDQYLHIGAPQTFRTTGRGVQMQNLPRLSDMIEMESLSSVQYSNTVLANNIRQLFTSKHKEGLIIVGDFSSVESRGLAYLAGADWKLRAFHDGKDMYKVLAASKDMFDKPYEDITKEERQSGKVGELSCGYGAGSGAIQTFAEKMGIDMSLDQAEHLKTSWRATNPEIVEMWNGMQTALMQALTVGHGEWNSPNEHVGIQVLFSMEPAPTSLEQQHPGVKSLKMRLYVASTKILERVFHGAHLVGNDIHYYKPSELKTGDLWKKDFMNPKTKRKEPFKIYGGKVTGILTQSFCREIFFSSLRSLDYALSPITNADLIGQFHDELVVDWQPMSSSTGGVVSLNNVIDTMKNAMTFSEANGVWLPFFPLDAEIKSDYRYIK